jgi:hypothetical protein
MERLKKNLSSNAIAFLLVSLMFISSLTILSSNIGYAEPEDNMTFTSGEKIDFTSDTEMTFKSSESPMTFGNETMIFGTGIRMRFTWAFGGSDPDSLERCDWIEVIWPIGFIPEACTWWEVYDPATGLGTGFEFHIDGFEPPYYVHIDDIYPPEATLPITPGEIIYAEKKIMIIDICEYFEVHWPSDWWPKPCSWWEIVDPDTGELSGYEFHVDWTNSSCEFHVDDVIGPSGAYEPWGPWSIGAYEVVAVRKIPGVKPCDYFIVHDPPDWGPEVCTWWEIMDPDTGEPTGYEFHVDWSTESCEFHVDQVIGPDGVDEPYIAPWPGVPYITAEPKIDEIQPCDWFIIVDPIDYLPNPCSWWEVLDDTGAPTDLEFHVDVTDGFTMFHVDITMPGEVITIPPSYTVTVRKKIDIIQPCDWFRVDDPTLTPESCSWWEILDDTGEPTGIEFHVDETMPADGLFHIDEVFPGWPIEIPPTHMLTAEKKIDDIQECDWFKVLDPPDFVPEPCSWWVIIWPPVWAGIHFHVDDNDGADMFHIDDVNGGGPPPPPPPPPPWNVTATPYEPPEPEDPWYIKSPYPDYALSGMPDFDERQWGTYIWQDVWGQWSHCGPVACANSLWWYDSKYEYYLNPSSPPPPAYSDSFPLVQSYGGPPWDDHDPQNLPFLVEHLAWLMDCDGMRTGSGPWSGTYVHDMEAGLAQYLSWSGVNPLGDVNGDGIVDPTDVMIVEMAMGSVPGGPGWDLAADIFPATLGYPPMTDNIIDLDDLDLVIMHLGEIGIFYEHTVDAWENWEFFWFVKDEVHRSQDVVLLLGFYIEGTDIREGGHYVTVAGVNSTTMELLISNPIRDDFEAGITPGRSPIPHVHLPPEPPYITHNNASLVSQDAYHVSLLPSPSGYHWIFDGYFDPGLEARIEYAVITSEIEPLPEPDIAVTNLTICRGQTICGQNLTKHINVTVTNEGLTNETFTLTIYWNTTNIIATTSVSLLIGETKIVPLTWEANETRYLNYTLSAYATPVLGETDIADNNYVDGTVIIVWPGDLDADKDVDLYDAVKLLVVYGAKVGMPQYNPNVDINCDGKIDLYDAVLLLVSYGYKEP